MSKASACATCLGATTLQHSDKQSGALFGGILQSQIESMADLLHSADGVSSLAALCIDKKERGVYLEFELSPSHPIIA